MATPYKKRILDYCAVHEITVPPGFGRNTPSRYAIIRLDITPNKLVAKTWFKIADVVYYLENILTPELGNNVSQSIRILDFQENQQLEWNGYKQLNPYASLS
jgi:hypothetical protein